MNSTLLNGRVPEYLGGDLTDRYSRSCRDVDVCGLTRGKDSKLVASFWSWQWDAAPGTVAIAAIAKELTAARAVMLDGPQGLATKGQTIRVCERQSAAVGKTPDHRPALKKPFAGFIRSSLDIFDALNRAGIQISPPGFLGGVSEVYPGHIWTILCGRRAIPKKSSDEGRVLRKRILEAFGISGLPVIPTHDQNDACVSALLAAAADGNVPGLTPRGIGSPLCADPDGTLREGLMVIPDVSAETSALILEVLRKTPTTEVRVPDSPANAASDSGSVADRANTLLDEFVRQALAGNPHVCTYAWAYRRLVDASYRKWSQAYSNQIINVARRTPLRELRGLGSVRLDAFVVASDSGQPSAGHWRTAPYDREDWERVLGSAVILE